MNYFIEGIQGSGKSTMVSRLSERYPDYHVFKEGFYSPVELAWCAYVDEETCQELLKKYPDLDLEANTYPEEDKRIICYTRIKTQNHDFYRELEQYEIYNDRKPLAEFSSIILNRYERWNGNDSIFECSLFQNIVEELILYKQLSDDEILSFYRKIRRVLTGKDFRISYLKTDDVSKTIGHIRKERIDEQGEEIWYQMLCEYFNASPYALKHGLKEEDGIIRHLKHRQELELKICEELFPAQSIILDSKNYDTEIWDRLNDHAMIRGKL
ncbi:MAG: hypothetical protein IKS51_05300 [Erysipelotrichaceae bacterium]|nr:hypothetical protein [Erysipelotrichaceae bacterium]